MVFYHQYDVKVSKKYNDLSTRNKGYPTIGVQDKDILNKIGLSYSLETIK